MPPPSHPRVDPLQVQLWHAAAERLRSAGRGERTRLIAELAAAHGLSSADAVYRRLRQYGGWESGRARRRDAGRMAVDETTLTTLAGVYREGARADGRRIMSLETAASVVEASGYALPVSTSQLARYLRAQRLDATSQRQATHYTELRSLHPNHVHQIDPSLCVLYYLRGQQHILAEDQLYKNKLTALAKIDTKIWRYVRYDHASGEIDVRYYQAAGESQALLFDFLLWTWGRQAERVSHGVPRILMWDAGSANAAHGIRHLLEALEVEALTHLPGRPNVKGGVENANRLVETGFESRLRFQPVDSVDALNARAADWCAAFNGNRLPRIDSRVQRAGADPLVRTELWMRIRAEELRELPPRAVCARLLEGKPAERVVNRQAYITYPHPALGRSVRYNLRAIPEIHRGDRVLVSPLLVGEDGAQGLIRLRWTSPGGEAQTWRLAPELALDDFGRPLSAPVIGATFHPPRSRAVEQAQARLDAAAYPPPATDAAADADPSAEPLTARERARRARRNNVAPFGGTLDAHAHLADLERTTYLPRRGTAIAASAPEDQTPPVPLVRALGRLHAAWGRAITPAEATWLRTRYGEAIPAPELERLLAGGNTDVEGPRPTAAASAPLVAVSQPRRAG